MKREGMLTQVEYEYELMWMREVYHFDVGTALFRARVHFRLGRSLFLQFCVVAHFAKSPIKFLLSRKKGMGRTPKLLRSTHASEDWLIASTHCNSMYGSYLRCLRVDAFTFAFFILKHLLELCKLLVPHALKMCYSGFIDLFIQGERGGGNSSKYFGQFGCQLISLRRLLCYYCSELSAQPVFWDTPGRKVEWVRKNPRWLWLVSTLSFDNSEREYIFKKKNLS